MKPVKYIDGFEGPRLARLTLLTYFFLSRILKRTKSGSNLHDEVPKLPKLPSTATEHHRAIFGACVEFVIRDESAEVYWQLPKGQIGAYNMIHLIRFPHTVICN